MLCGFLSTTSIHTRRGYSGGVKLFKTKQRSKNSTEERRSQGRRRAHRSQQRIPMVILKSKTLDPGSTDKLKIKIKSLVEKCGMATAVLHY